MMKKFCNTIQLITLMMSFSALQVHGQSLDTLLNRAAENNPELKALKAEFESIEAKSKQVSQLNDPKIGIGVPVLRPETRLGPQLMMVSAEQMFPWFGTNKAKEEVQIAMSKAEYEKIAAVKLNLFYEIKTAYYQLQFLQEEQLIIEKNIQLFQSIERTALAKVESGNATTADVLRVQTKIQALEKEIEWIEKQKERHYATINKVTNQPWGTSIELVDSMKVEPLLDYNLSAFEEQVNQHHPLIVAIDQKIQASKLEQIANQKSGGPKIGVGIDYSLLGQRTDANPAGNGRDILVPKVMVSIPLYRKKYKAKNLEEELKQESYDYQKENVSDRLIQQLINFKTDYDQALIQKELKAEQYQTTQRAYEVLLSDYSSTGKGFFDLIEVQSQLLTFDLAIHKAKLDANIAICGIERITNF